MKTCKAENCNNKHYCKGYCKKHYVQIQRHGKILDRTSKDKNEIVLHDDYAEIILYSKKQEEVARTIIDLDDIDKVKNYKWYLDGRGYVYCGTIRNSLHRLIINCPEDKVIDHINHNKLDNRKSNLRTCTQQQNTINRSKTSRNTSGYVGVCYKPKINKWQSYITVNKKPMHLGYYNTLEEAIEVRKQAEIKYFGEYRNKE